MGWTNTQTWAGLSRTVCVHLSRKTVKGKTLTDNKKERLRKRKIFNAWRLMHWHQLRSHVPQMFLVTSHIVGFRSVLHDVNFNCCRCNHLLNFDLYANSLWRFTLRKTCLLICCLYTPRRLQQTAVSCKRSNCNKIENNKNKFVKVVRLRFYPKTAKQRVSPFYHVALHVSSFVDFLWIIMSSTKNHSIATNWKKNSMIGANIDTSRMAWAWVVVLQILGVDGLM